MRDDLHLERSRAGRHFLADAAEADDAERLAAQLDTSELLLLPLPCLHGGIGGGQVPRQRQQLRHRELGDADAVRARRVHHDDAALRRGFEVDVVDARAGAGDDPKRGRGGNQVFGVTFVALRTTSASASASAISRSGSGRPALASTIHEGSSRRSVTAEAGRSSAITIFIGTVFRWKKVEDECENRSSIICRFGRGSKPHQRAPNRRTRMVQTAVSHDWRAIHGHAQWFFHRLFHTHLCEYRRARG